MITILIIDILSAALIGYIASKIMSIHGGFFKLFLIGLGGSILGGVISGLITSKWFISLLLSIAGSCLLITIFRKKL